MFEGQETEQERKDRERRENYRAELERRKKVSRATRKLRALPRHLLVRRVARKWSKFRDAFNSPPASAKSLSSATLRALLTTGAPPRPYTLGDWS